MKLRDCPVNKPIRIIGVPVPLQNRLRVEELGVRIGAHTKVIQRAGFGGVVLNIAGARIAIDHYWANQIEAEEIVA